MIQYCTFTVGGLCFGIDTAHVQEVIGHREMTAIPLAPPAVQGLINLRGQIVTAIDLGQRLDLSPAGCEEPPVHIVVDVDGTPVSLLIDAIGDVIDPDPSGLERPPDALAGPVRELITGVHQLPADLMLVLDVARVIDVVEV